MPDQPILLTADEVRAALPMADAIEAMKVAFVGLQTGRVQAPVRTGITMPAYGGSVLFMPAYGEEEGSYAVKIASIHEGNRAKGLEAVQAVVLLFEAASGKLSAMMDGKAVTAIRTAAGSGLATQLLARENASVLAVFGSGVQARSHVEAVCAARPVERVVCIGRTPANIRRFAEEVSEQYGIEADVGSGPSAAVDADIICTTTTATEPFLRREHVGRGAHINAVGTHRPTDSEIDAGIVVSAKVVVDQLEACLLEAGEIARPIRDGLIDKSHIFAELGEIAAGSKLGRETDDDITLFKSVGNAAQDLAAAAAVVQNARRLGLGSPLAI